MYVDIFITLTKWRIQNFPEGGDNSQGGAHSIFTVRNEVAKVMLLQASVCPRGEYLTRYTPRWDQVHPLGLGTSPGTRYTPPRTRYTPWGQVHPPGPGTPPWTRYTPLGPGTPLSPEIRPLLQMVRILLECILVCNSFAENCLKMKEFGPKIGGGDT